MAELLYYTAVPDENGGHQWPAELLQQISEQFQGKVVSIEAKVEDRRRPTSVNDYWWTVIIAKFKEGLRSRGYNIPERSAAVDLELHYWLIKQVFGDGSRFALDEETLLPYIHWPNDKHLSSSMLTRLDFMRMIEAARIWLLLEFDVLILDTRNAVRSRWT